MARLRMIAGPNGSGKTILTDHLRHNYDLDFGYYPNAGEVGKSLRNDLSFLFRKSQLSVSPESVRTFYPAHPSPDNLLPALRLFNRVYFFDHSGPAYELVAELNDSERRLTSDNLPNRLEETVINKL